MNFEAFDYIIAPKIYHAWYLRHKQGRWREHFQLITKEQLLADTRFRFEMDQALLQVIRVLKLVPGEALKRLETFRHLDENALKHPLIAPMYQPIFACLTDAKLLQINPLAHYKYRKRQVWVDGYLPTDPQLKSIIHAYEMAVQFQQSYPMKKKIHVKEMNSVEDEISYVLNHIISLRLKGIPLTQMYILLPQQDSYQDELDRQAAYYQIPLQKPNQTTLYALPITQKFLVALRQNLQESAILETLSAEDPYHASLLKSSLQNLNLTTLSLQERVTFLEQLFQQTYVKEPIFSQAIHLVKDLYPMPEDHVFVLGFAQGEYPCIQRDKSMLDETLQLTLGIETTSEIYQTKRFRVHQLLARCQNLYVSYAHFMDGKLTVPSPLIEMYGWQTERSHYLVNQTDYSGQLAKIRMAKFSFYQQQFNEPQPFLTAYKKAFPEPISLFSHQFTNLDADFTNKPLRLSYSALKDYYQCSFKYFVRRILKVKPMDQDAFYMHLGTFAHEVFETLGDNLVSFDPIFDNALANQKDLSAKEKVLFNHLREQLRKVSEFNAAHRRHMIASKIEAEKELFYQHDDQTSLVGFIDKIILLRTETGKEYIAVVDYKSGAESFDDRLIQYGWSLQLPIYALMLENHPNYSNKEVLGLFIQHIIETAINPDQIDIDRQSFPKKYQLDGIIVDDPALIALFDDTIQTHKASFLEGVHILKKGGFRQTGHIQSREAFQAYAKTAKTKIAEAANAIRRGEFPINPKNIARKSSCDYCPFIDTCFRKASDVQFITLPKKGETTDGDVD